MRIERNELLAHAGQLRFRPEMLEKVLQLIHLLNAIFRHPFLAGRVALKGGTALNLFIFDLPRLSVDIDLNYVGSVTREGTELDRPRIFQSIRAIAAREGFTITREPTEHAGGKFRLRYESELTAAGNVEIDINFMLRVPLWRVEIRDSIPVAGLQATRIPILDKHELAAGKLAALLARTAPRDLYDAHRLLRDLQFDEARLRLAFVVYGGFNRKDWRTVQAADVSFREIESADQLFPLLREGEKAHLKDAGNWGIRLVEDCRANLAVILPLLPREIEFLDRLLDHGHVQPELLTDDLNLQQRIQDHPGIRWKAHNVRLHMEGGRPK